MTTESKTEIISNSLSSSATERTGKELEKAAKQQGLTPTSFFNDSLNDSSINNIITCGIHFLALIGFANVGKSTFVASLYHKLMCEGCINDYDFIDSDTFVGFERRAHVRNAKIKSANRNARTSQQEGHLLSLEFVNKLKQHRKLVLSDRSGETYQTSYVNSINSVRADKALINCRHIVFFINAETLIDDGEYLAFDDKFDILLKQFKTAGVLDNSKQIDIIFNKIDKVVSDEDRKLFSENSKEIIEKIESCHGSKIMKKFEITSNRMTNNEDLNKVFKYFVECCFIEDQEQNKKVDWVKELLNRH